jgi:menaquinone-specific isochorismate synthase
VSVTEPLRDASDLIGRLPRRGGVAWLRDGEGFVAHGVAARVPAGTGPERFERASAALTRLFEGAVVDNSVGGWGTGPLAFGTFTFDADAPGSELVIPQVLYGSIGGRSWVTRTGRGQPSPAEEIEAVVEQPAPHVGAGARQDPLDEERWVRAVEVAREAILRGRLDKVVLSFQVLETATAAFDLRRVVRRLARGYPSCYTFAFRQLVGASPELLVRREGRSVHSVPLAGSAPRGAAGDDDAELGRRLLSSAKDRWEHDLAVVGVVESLHRLCRTLRIDPQPSLLRLANVQHLATEVAGELSADTTALEIAGAVHPTAAVCGTPTRKALALIRELEGPNRGRYAGPVGWVDAGGDGEWAITLRCAELSGRSARLYAGCGIVAQSDPEAELEEARLKLMPVRSALDLV